METTPVEVRRVDDREVHITWADGHTSVFTNRFLREGCACAACVHELTGQQLLNPASVPDGIRALEISLVGRYALAFRWSDGHSTGIYPFRRLRAWCQCDACRTAAPPAGG